MIRDSVDSSPQSPQRRGSFARKFSFLPFRERSKTTSDIKKTPDAKSDRVLTNAQEKPTKFEDSPSASSRWETESAFSADLDQSELDDFLKEEDFLNEEYNLRNLFSVHGTIRAPEWV